MEKDLEQFLAEKGVLFPISDITLDKCRLPKGETERQKKKRVAVMSKLSREYSVSREKAIKEYQELVRLGVITPRSKEVRLIENANGHPDHEQTYAARRMLVKKGISLEGNVCKFVFDIVFSDKTADSITSYFKDDALEEAKRKYPGKEIISIWGRA